MILKIMFNKPRLAALLVLGSLFVAPIARADDETLPEIKLRQGRFEPSEVVVPGNTPFKLRVTNVDAAAIEFESFELHRERVVQPGETVTVFLPALAPGTYTFVDDFHRDTPEGSIIAK